MDDSGAVLRDVKIPFGRMVLIVLKLALASIPALILASLVVTATAVAVVAVLGVSLLGTPAPDSSPSERPPFETGGSLPPLDP